MKKKLTQMTARELARATQEFDHPSPPGRFRPLTAAERRRWNQAIRHRGRPRKSDQEKAARILISIRPELLRAARTLARKKGQSLSGLISAHLQAAVSRKRRSA